MCYKFITDKRKPILIKHSHICYPPPRPDLIDQVDTSYPGIVIDFENGYYLIEDGVHRIGKFQKQGIFESLFYVVSIEEYKSGIVHLMHDGNDIVLGEWSHNNLSLINH